MHDERTALAANNNADFYEAMFTSHHRQFERKSFAFLGRDAPPPYYSNLTVLAPAFQDDVVAELRLMALSFEARVGFKDSFCEFDLREQGFRTLFRASWVWSASQQHRRSETWIRIDEASSLEAWETGWKRSGSPIETTMFANDLLSHPDLAFFGQKLGGEFVAGCIANKSAECVGISNVFSSGDLIGSFREAAAAVSSFAPGLPIVSYDSGPLLSAAQQTGFLPIGDLQVLVTDRAHL